MITRTPFSEFKTKALQNAEVQQEYEALIPAYTLRKKLVALRKTAGLTQEQLAEMMNTQKSNISRLESVNSSSSPKLSTLEAYAKATGYKLEVNFTPI